MTEESPESLGKLWTHEIIWLAQRFNSNYLSTPIATQLMGQITWEILSWGNLLGAQIDEISQTQSLINQINDCLNIYWVWVRVVSIWNIQIRWGTSDIQRIVPFVSDVSKFETFISEDNEEAKTLVRFIVDCIMKYGVKVHLGIYPREVEQTESDELLMDLVTIVSEIPSIPEELNEIVARYKKWELLWYIIVEEYFSGELESIINRLAWAIEKNEFFDISVITETFEDAIAVLKWAMENTPTILEEYQIKLSQYFFKFCIVWTRMDSSCPYLLSGREFPTWMKTNSINLLILMNKINETFPNIIDKQEIWIHLNEDGK